MPTTVIVLATAVMRRRMLRQVAARWTPCIAGYRLGPVRASILRSLLAACLLGGAVYALTAGGASGQEYQLPPPVAEPLPMLSPFPVVRIRGVATPTGARINLLTVRARVGVTVVRRCAGSGTRCPYSQRTQRVRGQIGRTRTIHIGGFERRFSAGVNLRLFVVTPGRTGKFTSFTIRRRRSPRRTNRCVRGLELKPVLCPA